MRTLLLLAAFPFVLAFGTLACSGSTLATDDGSTPDSGAPDLVPSGSTKAVVSISGGFTGPGGDGSTCHSADDTYTLDLGTKALTWKICRADDAGVYAYVTGNKALSDTEFSNVSAKMHALERATATKCGADAPDETIVFSAPAGDTTLYDDFYFCDKNDTKIYVTNLGDVISALSGLAQ